MRLRPTGWLSWQLVLLLLLALVCGSVVGALGATILYMREAEPLSRELNRRSTRIALLEMLVQQHSPDSVDSLEASVPVVVPVGPAPAASAPVAIARAVPVAAAAPTVAAAIPSPPARPAVAPPALVPRAPAIQAVAARQPVPATAPSPSGIQAAAPAAEPRAEVTEPVTGDELVVAMRARIEGVSGEKAGVKGLEKGSVLLRNGGVVRVGQLFPSGEKLLQVDHENNRVVTTKRQMLLFFPN